MMDTINLRGRRKRSFYPKVIIAFLIFMALILFRATWNVFVKDKETKENLIQTEMDLEDLKNKEESLEKQIKNLSTARGVDQEIKTKFRVTKEGESMIVLIDSPGASSTLKENGEEGFWSRFLNLFSF